MIAIVDYGVGNLSSVKNILRKVGNYNVVITSSPEDLLKADKVILPGVGKFDYGMNRLNDSGLVPVLEKKALIDKVPFLGICLGAQLITKSSEEGSVPGLGWIEGKTVSFKGRIDSSFKIPHMGWAEVNIMKNFKLSEGWESEPRFYFVHSYFLELDNKEDEWLTTRYDKSFTAAYQRENIIGCQFHPEKSHVYGITLMRNFSDL